MLIDGAVVRTKAQVETPGILHASRAMAVAFPSEPNCAKLSPPPMPDKAGGCGLAGPGVSNP